MENKKLYKLGLVCGRFSHVQNGHLSLINTSLYLGEKTLVLVSSAQEYGTLRNPFKAETRIRLLQEIYSDKNENELSIKPINDLTNEYDLTNEWGEYVKKQVEEYEGRFADLIVYGNEPSKETWFKHNTLINTAKHILPRDNNLISGTLIRGMLVIDDKKNWEKNTHFLIHSEYENLRDELMNIPVYKEIYDNIKNQLSLDNFMKYYTKLEAEDKIKKEQTKKGK